LGECKRVSEKIAKFDVRSCRDVEITSLFDVAAGRGNPPAKPGDPEFRCGTACRQRLFHKRDRAAMGEHQLAGDRQAEAGAAGAGGAAEGGKEVLARLGGMPGPVSSTVMLTTLPTRWADTRDALAPAVPRPGRRQRLQRVAAEIVDDAEQLLAVGIDLEAVGPICSTNSMPLCGSIASMSRRPRPAGKPHLRRRGADSLAWP
jgi:hypothetical protein